MDIAAVKSYFEKQAPIVAAQREALIALTERLAPQIAQLKGKSVEISHGEETIAEQAMEVLPSSGQPSELWQTLARNLTEKQLDLKVGKEAEFSMKIKGVGKILFAIKVRKIDGGQAIQATSMFVNAEGDHWQYPMVEKAAESTESMIRRIAAGRKKVSKENQDLFEAAIANDKIVLALTKK